MAEDNEFLIVLTRSRPEHSSVVRSQEIQSGYPFISAAATELRSSISIWPASHAKRDGTRQASPLRISEDNYPIVEYRFRAPLLYIADGFRWPRAPFVVPRHISGRINPVVISRTLFLHFLEFDHALVKAVECLFLVEHVSDTTNIPAAKFARCRQAPQRRHPSIFAPWRRSLRQRLWRPSF